AVVVVVDEREEAVQFLIAGVDRGAVGRAQLAGGNLPALEQALGVFGREAERVDHAAVSPVGGTRKKSSSRSGAVANTWSSGRAGRGSSARKTLTTSSGGEVGGTSEGAGAETLPPGPGVAF